MTGVYLIHFSEPYRHAKHYIGWSQKIAARFQHHQNGTGANLCAVAVARGIGLEIVRIWEGKGRDWERKVKNYKKTKLLCPVCNKEHALELMKG